MSHHEPPFGEWPPVVVQGARACALTLNGHTYTLSLAMPEAAPPPAGYPMALILDADSYFASAVEMTRRLSLRPQGTGVSPMVIVGLDANNPGENRHRDFTAGPAASADDTPANTPVGGAAAFLDALMSKALPLIERQCPIDATRRTLIGHSLAGYFVLLALGLRPRAFSAYGAVSPSLWWDDAALTSILADADLSSARLFLAVGEEEEQAPPRTPRHASRRMISRLQAVATALAPRAGRFEHHIYARENHGSVAYASLPRLLSFASGLS